MLMERRNEKINLDGMMTHAEFNTAFRKRTKAFAVDVFQFLEGLSPNNSTRTIAYQLGKSASSVGANFRAFCRGRSQREKFAKICVVVEEADESQYWLEIVEAFDLGTSEQRAHLLREVDEITRIVSTIKSKIRPK